MPSIKSGKTIFVGRGSSSSNLLQNDIFFTWTAGNVQVAPRTKVGTLHVSNFTFRTRLTSHYKWLKELERLPLSCRPLQQTVSMQAPVVLNRWCCGALGRRYHFVLGTGWFDHTYKRDNKHTFWNSIFSASNQAVYAIPFSHARSSCGSKGTEPRNGTPISSAIWAAPPVTAGNTSDFVLQQGHTKPAIFSTTPKTRMPTCKTFTRECRHWGLAIRPTCRWEKELVPFYRNSILFGHPIKILHWGWWRRSHLVQTEHSKFLISRWWPVWTKDFDCLKNPQSAPIWKKAQVQMRATFWFCDNLPSTFDCFM